MGMVALDNIDAVLNGSPISTNGERFARVGGRENRLLTRVSVPWRASPSTAARINAPRRSPSARPAPDRDDNPCSTSRYSDMSNLAAINKDLRSRRITRCNERVPGMAPPWSAPPVLGTIQPSNPRVSAFHSMGMETSHR